MFKECGEASARAELLEHSGSVDRTSFFLLLFTVRNKQIKQIHLGGRLCFQWYLHVMPIRGSWRPGKKSTGFLQEAWHNQVPVGLGHSFSLFVPSSSGNPASFGPSK